MNKLLINNDRQQKIIDLLLENNVMEVKDLAKKLSVSPVTIRRDLDYLDSLNYISKFHGSVTLVKSENPQTLFMLSLEKNKAAKQAIAKAAVSLLNPKSIISVDSGSTTCSIADQIPPNYSVKVVTNCLFTALKFAQNLQNEVIQVGGLIHPDTSSTTDFLATEFLHKFRTDFAFITANAFNMPLGAYDAIVSLIESKRASMNITKRVVLLMDSSKFSRRSMYLSVPINNVHTLITDEKTPHEIIQQLKDMGKETIVVDTDTKTIIEHYNKIS
jgi:DeoR family transcriptional regulator of aga operon